MPFDMDAILRAAQDKALQTANQRKNALEREKKDRAIKIASHRETRNLETRKVKLRNVKDKAELLLQECAPVIIRHLDTKRCMECFTPIPDIYFMDELPEGERRPESCDHINSETNERCGYSHANSIRRQTKGLDGARIIIRCSKSDSGAFSAAIVMAGDKPDNARNFPAGSLRTLAEKNDWQNTRFIEWLMKDERTTVDVVVRKDGKEKIETRIAGYNCRSVPEMLEEIVRLRQRVHFLEDELATARKPARKCEACAKDMDESEAGSICLVCNLKGKGA